MNSRTIVLILALISLISTVTGGYLYYNSAQKAAVKETERELAGTTNELKEDIDGLISDNQNQVRVMARFEQLQKAILNQDHASISEADRILDHFAQGHSYDVCYLMDGSGKTIASSNRNAKDSFVGHNYAFRPYFVDAIKGKPGLHLAVGVTSGMRGIYFSHPVYLPEGGLPIGVAVIKSSTRDLDRVLSRKREGIALLVHSSGIIFASSDENATLKRLWKDSPEELSKIAETQQFGKGPWNWSGLEKMVGAQVLDSSGEFYIIEEVGLGNLPGWRIVDLYSFRAVYGKIVDPLVGKTGLVALMLCFFVGGAVICLYFMAQKDIRSRKQAEETMKESERRSAQIIEFLPDATMVIDVQGKLIAWNQAIENLTGIKASSMLGKGDYEYALPFYGQRRPVMLDLVIKQEQETLSKYVYFRREGDRLVSETYMPDFCGRGPTWLWNVAAPLYDQDGRVDGAIEAIRDITDHKHAEQQLKESEEKYRSLFENSIDGIFITELDGTLLDANQSFLDLFGYTKEEILGKSVIKMYVNPDDRYQFQQVIEKDGYIKDYPLNLVKKDGTEIDCLLSATIRKAIDGRILGYRGIFRDVTERKRIEEALQQSEATLRTVLKSVPIGIGLVTNRIFGWTNESLSEMTGYSAADFLGQGTRMLYESDEEFDRIGFEYGHVKEGGAVSVETRFKCKDGTIIDVILSLSAIMPGDLSTGVVFSVIDITQRKLAEVALEKRIVALTSPLDQVHGIEFDDLFNLDDIQKLQDQFAQASGVASIITHTDGRPITRASNFRRLCNDIIRQTDKGLANCYKSDSVIGRYHPERPIVSQCLSGGLWDAGASITVGGRHIANWLIGQVRNEAQTEEKMRDYAREIGMDEESVVEAFLEVPTMPQKQFEAVAQALFTLASQLSDVAYQNIQQARFITQLKKAELEKELLQQQLFQAQKMEAVGTLAGGIAHDFNNLLQIVLGYSEVMLLRKKEGEHDYVDLHQIYQAGKRGADLVTSLMTFSRKVEANFIPVDLNQEITQLQDLLSHTIPKIIKFDLRLSGDLEVINADRSQIGQVLMNLGVNARDAMPDGGTLTIETANVVLDKEYCSAHLEAIPGSYVLLTVSDTGQGMDKETLSHIFEPFFSTKEVGRGTGLGLATVYGIVKQHSGHITCYSEPGLGTTFKIYFPAIEKERVSETATVERPIPGGTETVLLVDDEESLRDLGTTLLNKYGYRVITASNGKEALETYRRMADRISLIMLDLLMPVMDGETCLEEILRVNPNAKVVIASGVTEQGQGKGAMGFVQKPFDMRQLLTTVREVLDQDIRGPGNTGDSSEAAS